MKAYLISALVGAVIGYITNWLAIKMLFKPHKEKRIFGMKIPFTPGLIPKEKERIAKSVGDTVGEHILTNEIMTESLRDKEILNSLKSILNKKVYDIFDTNSTIEEILRNIDEDNRFIKENFQKNVYSKIIELINNKENIVKISNDILNLLLQKIKEKPLIIQRVIKSKKFRECLLQINKEQKDNKILDNEIKTFISGKVLKLIEENKSLNDIIPDNINNNISGFVYSQKDLIAQNLIKALEDNSFSTKIKEIIGDILPSMMSMFMSVDSLYEKLFSAVKEYLLVEENKIILCNYIISILNNFQDTKIEDIIRAMSEEDFNNLCQCASDLVNDKLLSDENIITYIDKLENYLLKIDSYESIILKIDKDYEKHLKAYLDENIAAYLKTDNFNNLMKNGTNMVTEYLLKLKVTDIFNEKEKAFDFIWKIVENYYNNFVEKDAKDIVDIINIPKLIEKQINSFDVSYAEKLIVRIARKELGAITWLGALLGAVLGVLSPLLSRLYS
ncbi:MAG: DUF445 family protein [Clostridium perfringens]|nr:DUF445 family protein [Clostridium perfringens]